MQIKLTADKSAIILQAFLDMFQHAVWISDPDGNLLMNEEAQALVAQGFSPYAASKSSNKIFVKGQRFRLDKREMNHGTGCLLHELRACEDESCRRIAECLLHDLHPYEDESCRRMLDSTTKLAAMLDLRGQASV